MYTDKNQLFFGLRLINVEKQLHFDFKSVCACYFNRDTGMSLLTPVLFILTIR